MSRKATIAPITYLRSENVGPIYIKSFVSVPTLVTLYILNITHVWFRHFRWALAPSHWSSRNKPVAAGRAYAQVCQRGERYVISVAAGARRLGALLRLSWETQTLHHFTPEL